MPLLIELKQCAFRHQPSWISVFMSPSLSKNRVRQSEAELTDAEILSFQQQAEMIEQEKQLKRKEREEKKFYREQKKKWLVYEKLTGPILLVLTLVLSALIYFISSW